MSNPNRCLGFIEKEPQEFSLADWGFAYRKFIEREKFLERWPFPSEKERRAAWEEWKAYAIYLVGM